MFFASRSPQEEIVILFYKEARQVLAIQFTVALVIIFRYTPRTESFS